jgi:hypothetical protein
MRLAMWTYPWDVVDIGLDAVAHDLRERAGLNGINLATAYHAGRFLQPRSPKRKVYFTEDGTIYFRPTAKRWEGLALLPKVAEIVDDGGDVLRTLVDDSERTGLSVSCWTVCLHNMRLGLLHPGVCTRNAYGDVNSFSLCPSHPDARAYAIALVADLTHGYAPQSVQLETPGFLPYAHGFHHEKDGVGLSVEDDFLLSLCFCDACLARAKAAGVDGEAARRTVRRWIDELVSRPVPVRRWPNLAAQGPDAFRDYPEVQAYILWRTEPVTSLVAAIKDAADPRSKIYYVADLDEPWRCGCDPAALAKASDGLVLCVYDRSPEKVGNDLAASRAAIGPDLHLGTGMRVFYPEMQGPEDLVSRSVAAAKAGASEINYYNYGLVPAGRLDWVRAATDAVEKRQLGGQS